MRKVNALCSLAMCCTTPEQQRQAMNRDAIPSRSRRGFSMAVHDTGWVVALCRILPCAFACVLALVCWAFAA